MNLHEAREAIEYKRAWENYNARVLQSTGGNGIIKEWDEDAHPRGEDGRFVSTGGTGGTSGSGKSSAKPKTKYAPSPQRQKKGIQVSHKKYAQLTGILNTHYPNLKPEDGEKMINDSNYTYRVVADGYGGMTINSRTKIK